MKLIDALNLLGLEPQCTKDQIKQAYKSACKKYHPDINPAGEQMMKLVNDANDTLADYDGSPVKDWVSESSYPDKLNDALMAIVHLQGLNIEICGSWVWVSGDTKTNKDTLKQAGYKYAAQKQMWNYRPANHRSFSRGSFSMDDIRSQYGSKNVKTKTLNQLD